LFLWALLLFPALLHAQTDPLYEDWRWVHFTTASGLPSNTIINIVETTEGVVWAHTAAGLAWYDGFRWQGVGEAEGLPSAPLHHLVPDLQGGVLVQALGRLYRGHQEGFNVVPLVVQGDTLNVGTVVPLDEGGLLIASPRRLFQHDGTQPIEVGLPPEMLLTSLGFRVARTRDGTIWLISHL